MNTISIANGVTLSEISLGAGRLGSSDPAQDAAAHKIMDVYAALGGRTFDTARIYAEGRCDISLGAWLRSRGERGIYTVVTKGSHPNPSNMFAPRLARADIIGDLETSLSAIGIEYSDLHILHRDDIRTPVEGIIDALDEAVRSGKTRAVGVSNWAACRIIAANKYAESAGKTKISCLQSHFSLALTTEQAAGDLTYAVIREPDLSYYKEIGLPIMAFGAQARGWFSQHAERGAAKPSPAKYYEYLPENHRRLERIIALSKETGHSIAALVAAYARDCGAVVSPLCAFTSEEQVRQTLECVNFRLTEGEVQFLRQGAASL